MSKDETRRTARSEARQSRREERNDDRRDNRREEHDDPITKRPSHIAFQVRSGEDGKAYFNRIGSAFPHKDGEGFNVLLDAVPVDGKVTLRTPQERLEETRKGSRRTENRRNRNEGPSYER